jgi:ferredoxin
MINLTIDTKKITAREGTSVLQAAQTLGIEIPTMCYLERCGPLTSCMVCVVYEAGSDRLIPACSMPVAEGMRIDTTHKRVLKARKDTLDLLLSEHVGNCEGPCQRACPAYMNIPLMIRQIKASEFREALQTVKKNIALPAVLGRICPAPCERGCNRKYHDGTLSICMLKRFVADADLASEVPYMPEIKEASGKKVAIIGAGPAGLAAAFYLLPAGHTCHVFDDHAEPGGLLRYGIPDEKYDKSVLDAEIEVIRKMGVDFRMNMKLGRDLELADLRKNYDAVVLASGHAESEQESIEGPERIARGIMVDRRTFQTSLPGVFAGGNVLAEGRMAIRSLAHGRFIAESINQLFEDRPLSGYERRFNSVIGKLNPGEGQQFVQLAADHKSVQETGHDIKGFTAAEAVHESARCFKCDCRKKLSCKLRNYADKYSGSQQRFKTGDRREFELNVQHEMVLFEPGKCVKCGLCVEITKQSGEDLGLTFVKRGFDVGIAVPLNESLQKGLVKVARECVQACPTAALALRDTFEGD